MRRYRNLKTGSVIEISGELTGENWEALDALPCDPDDGAWEDEAEEEIEAEAEELPEEIPVEEAEEKTKKKAKKKGSKE